MADNDDLVGAAKKAGDWLTGGPVVRGITAAVDALGLGSPATKLPSNGYNPDGSPPATPVLNTPTGMLTTQDVNKPINQ